MITNLPACLAFVVAWSMASVPTPSSSAMAWRVITSPRPSIARAAVTMAAME